jgi:hypothetical protein
MLEDGRYDRLVILSAGRSTRLDGRNKLLVEADGMPVHEWHKRARGNLITDVVVGQADWSSVHKATEQWVSRVKFHTEFDGAGGALRHYVFDTWHDGGLIVLFADTLLETVPSFSGSWVGVAPGPWRVWDYPDGKGNWVRGVPQVPVCCGVYRFHDIHLLRAAFRRLPMGDTLDMIDVLNIYQTLTRVEMVNVHNWQDAGDHVALSKVKNPWRNS